MSAVKKYQRDNGIKQTGFVGNVTAGKLGVTSMASGASQTTTGGKTQTTTGGKTQTTTGGKTQTTSTGQSKVTTKDPSDINSYPACVRFANPTKSRGGQWGIPGKNFYEGYRFCNNGKYISSISTK
jgi:type IV secretory pathway TrbL component